MALFDFLFSNPADDAMKYLNKVPSAVTPYYTPFINAGQEAASPLKDAYSKLLSNPGGVMNDIGSNYHESPGFQFALQQALQGGNQAAAAGGMAGSPQHEQQNMQLATNLGNQDYYNYLNPALGLYGAGLSGEQNLFNTGYGASTDLATTLANLFGTQGSLSYAGGANQNQMGLGTLGLGAGVLSSFNNPLKSLANAFSFS